MMGRGESNIHGVNGGVVENGICVKNHSVLWSTVRLEIALKLQYLP